MLLKSSHSLFMFILGIKKRKAKDKVEGVGTKGQGGMMSRKGQVLAII